MPRENVSDLYLLDSVFTKHRQANIIPIMTIKLGYKIIEELSCKPTMLKSQVENCLDILAGDVRYSCRRKLRELGSLNGLSSGF